MASTKFTATHGVNIASILDEDGKPIAFMIDDELTEQAKVAVYSLEANADVAKAITALPESFRTQYGIVKG